MTTQNDVLNSKQYTNTSEDNIGLALSGSSYSTNTDSDSVDSGALQLVYSVACAIEKATGLSNFSVSVSPHHF